MSGSAPAGPADTGPGDVGAASADAEYGRRLAATLDLAPLPGEGGQFRSTFTGSGASAILYMLIGDDFSAMHRLRADEIYFHHAGAPLRMLLIDPAGSSREVVIGPDVLAGQQPQFAVPGDWWQGSSADGGWSLISTVVSPGFDWADFTLGDRARLSRLCPGSAHRITELTRAEPPRSQPPDGL